MTLEAADALPEPIVYRVQVWVDGWPKRTYDIERPPAGEPNSEWYARQVAQMRYKREMEPRLGWNYESWKLSREDLTCDRCGEYFVGCECREQQEGHSDD